MMNCAVDAFDGHAVFRLLVRKMRRYYAIKIDIRLPRPTGLNVLIRYLPNCLNAVARRSTRTLRLCKVHGHERPRELVLIDMQIKTEFEAVHEVSLRLG